MRAFGIAGHSGMGKTTLLERLVPELRSRGLSVSLIKHSHKAIEIDRPGKDSHRLREAGCSEVLLMGLERWALMHELRGADEPSLDYLVSRLQRCDIVLIEGFKKKNDWCKEHDLPESQCFKCHPELKEQFAAQYKAKYGKEPPATQPET